MGVPLGCVEEVDAAVVCLLHAVAGDVCCRVLGGILILLSWLWLHTVLNMATEAVYYQTWPQ